MRFVGIVRGPSTVCAVPSLVRVSSALSSWQSSEGLGPGLLIDDFVVTEDERLHLCHTVFGRGQRQVKTSDHSFFDLNRTLL